MPGSAGGAHTTAFQLFIEIVENALFDATYDQAVGRMDAMIDDLEELPGYAGNATQRKALKEARNALKEARTQADDPANWNYHLEELIFRHLRARNSLNFTYHEGTWGDPGGHKEAKNIRKLSKVFQDTDWSSPTAAEIDSFTKSSVKLLDLNNVAQGTMTRAAYLDKLEKILIQHHATIISAHPSTEDQVGPLADALVTKVAPTLGLSGPEQATLGPRVAAARGWQELADAS